MQAQKPFFHVGKERWEDDGKLQLKVMAGTLDIVSEGRQFASGDVLMYMPLDAEHQSALNGWMAFPERAYMAFSGSLDAMRVLWMRSRTKASFLRDRRFSFWRP